MKPAYFPSLLFLATLGLTLASLSAVSFMWQDSAALTAITAAISTFILAMKRDWKEAVFYAGAGVMGASAESTAIFFGAWSYSAPDFAGIPFWLPFLWGIAAVFLIRAWKELEYFTSFVKASR
ncbi:MAG: hypothetical protein J4431_01065 [Candidatus Aenigmarchaeota archaeon]|nr:hypothetical protein [Candidatus Aenigmarchaeota archaeon]